MPTDRPTAEQLTAAAAEAATAWQLDVTDLALVGLTENAVFRVDTRADGPLILRLHRPGYNTAREMDAEVTWVNALREGGLDVPAARPTPDGANHVAVDVVDDGGAVIERRMAGMIDWVDGDNLETIAEAGTNTIEDHFRGVGRLLATIRRHGQSWRPPPGFTRRRWDAAGLAGPDPLWGRFWEVPDGEGERARLRAARDLLFDQMASLPVERSDFGLIHADLHLRNVMVDGDRLVVIDFDDCGFGWYVHEVAVALHPVTDEPWYEQVRDALVAGYREIYPFGEADLERLPMFLTVRSLMLVGWLAARPELPMHQYLPVVITNAIEAFDRYESAGGL